MNGAQVFEKNHFPAPQNRATSQPMQSVAAKEKSRRRARLYGLHGGPPGRKNRRGAGWIARRGAGAHNGRQSQKSGADDAGPVKEFSLHETRSDCGFGQPQRESYVCEINQ